MGKDVMTRSKNALIPLILILAFILIFPGCNKKKTPLKAKLSFKQLTLDLDDGIHENSSWGAIDIIYETDPTVPVLYFNLSRGNEWVIRNLPVQSGGKENQNHRAWIAFSLGATSGTPVNKISYGYGLNRTIIKTAPLEDAVVPVVPHKIILRSGFIGQQITFQPSLIFPQAAADTIVDSAFHPKDKIVNQECELQECFPAAVSNSLKMLKKLYPDKMRPLTDSPDMDNDDTDIETVKEGIDFEEPRLIVTDPVTGEEFYGGGANMSDRTDDPKACWNQKKKWLDNDPRYPIETKIIDDFSKLDELIDAIKRGCDIEFIAHGHIVMVTGITKSKNGDYVFQFVEDTAQGKPGGTETPPSYVSYNATKKEFEGHPTFQGEKYEGPNKGAPLFMIECVKQ